MKKMIKKVIVAVLAMAMALGMMTVAASAADGDKTIVVVLSDELATGEKLLLDIDGQSAGITSSATVNTSLGWGRDMYEFTKDPSNNKIYKIVINGDVGADKYCNFQIIRLSATNSLVKGVKYYPQDGRDVFNGNDTVYITFDLNAGDWAVVTASATDPTAITADEVEAAIAAIGTVALTDECKDLIAAASAKVSAYEGDTSDIDNYATYTAAKARWDELVENGAGTLKLHVKYDWAAAAVYTYGVNDGTVWAAGAWPGTVPTANANNDGWKDVTVTTESAVNVIVNNNGNGEEVETKYVSAGEYWITVSSTPNGADLSISPDAPDGWSTGVPAGDDDENETTTVANDDENETTTVANDDENETTTVADDDDENTTTTAANDDDENTTTTAADDDDENTTTTAADDDDENETTTVAADDEGGSSAGDTPAGDNSMVAIFAILAVLAAAGVVTVAVAKRRAIEE